jgi:hypothetical protein
MRVGILHAFTRLPRSRRSRRQRAVAMCMADPDIMVATGKGATMGVWDRPHLRSRCRYVDLVAQQEVEIALDVA